VALGQARERIHILGEMSKRSPLPARLGEYARVSRLQDRKPTRSPKLSGTAAGDPVNRRKTGAKVSSSDGTVKVASADGRIYQAASVDQVDRLRSGDRPIYDGTVVEVMVSARS